MDNFPIYIHFLLSFIGTAGFAVFINCPRIDVLISGLIGAMGWITYRILLVSTHEILFPYFFATMAIGILAGLVTKWNKKPTIIYIIPGVIPLVPGYNMYYTMYYLVLKQYETAFKNAVDAIFIAFAIASGLLFTESLRKITNTMLEKRFKVKLNNHEDDTIS